VQIDLSLETIVIGLFGTLIAVITWFIKRDISRFERHIESHAESIAKATESINQLQIQIGGMVGLREWIGHLDRFFGESGGQKRMWIAIEGIKDDVNRIREREHWIANKVAIIKGRCEIAGMKFGTDEWTIPVWTTESKE
jgi:hypothetical protein